MDQFDLHLYMVTRHAHLNFCVLINILKLCDNACDISCSEIELRTIVSEERCMTAALVFGQNVNLALEMLMRVYSARFCKNLTSFDLVSLNTTKKASDVITSFCEIKSLTEHLDTGYNNLSLIFLNTYDLNSIGKVKHTSLYTACSYSTTACD